MNTANSQGSAARTSRCTQPEGAPYTWEDFRDGTVRTVEIELEELMGESCPTEYEFTGRMAAVKARRERAAAGELAVREKDGYCTIKPIRDRPEIWELRWCFDGREFRIYHAEPVSEPAALIALRCHWKVVEDANGHDLPSKQVDDLQDAEILNAVVRFTRLCAQRQWTEQHAAS